MTTIVYNGVTYAAAVCRECGGKVWPPSALRKHQAHHREIVGWFRSTAKPLRLAMRRFTPGRYAA